MKFDSHRITLPNVLTILRILLVPVYMGLAMAGTTVTDWIAFLIFLLASLTDKLDGYLARKHNLVTSFGKIMDPLADKLLVTAAFIVFLQQGRMGAVPLMLIIAREFAVSSLRVVAMGEGKLMAAGWSGKIKTVLQMVVICVMLGLPLLGLPLPLTVEHILGWLLAAVTVLSGIDYFWANRALIKTGI